MKCLTTALIVASLAPILAYAQADTDTEELRAELDALRARLDALDESAGDTSRLEFSGDLRYRHETINDDGAATERNRHRIRARFGMSAELSDDLTVGFTLATGATNPVSANQTLGGGFSRKDIGFDRAFFAWDINDELTLRGGKMGIPWFRPGGNHLIVDSDLNPEGLAMGYDSDRVFANIGGFWVSERGGSDQDGILYLLQGGHRSLLGDGAELTIGASYFDYEDVQGFAPPYLGLPQGNTVDMNGNLVNDYNLAEIFAQLDLEAGGRPLRLFVDLVENTEADDFESGFAVGLRWGSASNPGDWEIGWSYEDLEADAVIANFTDSDFIGGGTDGRGHILRGAYRLRDNVRLNGTYFLNETEISTDSDIEYKRLQLDINFMF